MTLSRRGFLQIAGAAAAAPAAILDAREAGTLVNDVHSQLNQTRVREIIRPRSQAQLAAAIRKTRGQLSVCGGRHSMGGQQFGSDTTLMDIRSMNDVLHFDQQRGIIEVESGIEWPKLIHYLVDHGSWAIAQKQTGADALTIGGALASNVHGRGLTMKPIVADVESFVLIDGQGRMIRCSREENIDRFRLAIGGYGLFGVISSVALRLVPRRKLRRVVEVQQIDDIMARFDERIRNGFLYGDFQFAIDPRSEDFLRRGVFSCYQPLPDSAAVPNGQRELSGEDWNKLLYLAHTSKTEAFERYAAYYLSTNGQIYWSDVQQLGYYVGGYHAALDQAMHAPEATEIITEVYVPRPQLAAFMRDLADDFRGNNVNVIYGTVRLIERDDETFLAWAKQSYACIVMNLHVVHSPEGIQATTDNLRRLIDLATARDGSFYLTYHRYATARQLEACYPQFRSFLAMKRTYDPGERFTSDWYQHSRRLMQMG
ncbi:MAG TPA: FAD-binding oxidoreductase [Thermoanaerobaculia bacterium]|nr:FAD-binding oxidoreductase [Thermoanaerobaculia bacterium]